MSRWCAAGSTRRRSSSSSTRRRSWAPWAAPATPRARASAPEARWRARSRSGASSASPPTSTTPRRTARGRGRRAQRQARRDRRLRPRGPHRRLAARPARATPSGSSRPRPKPGGFLRHAIPAYRLPHEVVDDDIANVTAIGVDIVTGHAVRDLEALQAEGYDAVLVATGTPRSMAWASPARTPTGRPQRPGVPAQGQPGRAARPHGQGRGGRRRRQRRDGRGTHRSQARVPRGPRAVPPRSRGDARSPRRGRRGRDGGRPVRVSRRARRRRHRLRRSRPRAALPADARSAQPTPPAAGVPSPSPGASSCCSMPRSSSRPSAWSRTTRSYEHRHGRRARPPDQGRPDHPAERPPVPVRSRRRRVRRLGHHARHRPRASGGVHDRPLDPRAEPGRVPAVRRPAGSRAARRRPVASEHVHPARARARRHRALQQPDRLLRARACDDGGGGARGRRRLPRLRCLLGVPGVREGLPGRRDPARHEGCRGRGRGRRRGGVDRLQALRRRPEA